MFRHYELKRGSGVLTIGDWVMLTRETLRFSEDVWRDFFGNASHIGLYYEEESRRIGIKASQEGQGLKVVNRGGRSPEIHWSGFLKAFCLVIEERKQVKIERDGEMAILRI